MTDQRPFHFRQFSLFHHRSTMRIGTDAVLLGCWVEAKPGEVALDIGTGCGILSLMLAQKGVAQVDAVDIDPDSISEARINFNASRWRERLQAIQSDITEFRTEKRYDLIVSNPPFFFQSSKCDTDRKSMARHTDMTLSFDSLCEVVRRLLKPDGRFALVLPIKEYQAFWKVSEKMGFYLHKKMNIIPLEGREPNRVNIELGMSSDPSPTFETFTIRDADGRFTEEYHALVKAYYLG